MPCQLPSRVRVALLRSVFRLAAALAIGSAATNRALAVDLGFDLADRPVHAVATSGSTLYLGGDFIRVGRPTPNAVGLSSATGRPVSIPDVDSEVYAVAPDGSGGWYLGGRFHVVGGIPREKLAHVLADGTVAPWDPQPGYDVYTITVSGSTVYVGGHFATIGTETRYHVAAIDAVTGVPTAWNPNAGVVVSTSVNSIVVRDGIVYLGGDFTRFGGVFRQNLVAVDSATAQVLDWDPGADAPVHTLLLRGNTLYAGGGFTTMGGQPRQHLAAIDAATGVPTGWDPDADGTVQTLEHDGSTIYAGGTFQNIGGQPRAFLAALDSATGGATPWQAHITNSRPGFVNALHRDASTLYVGGEFDSIGGSPRSNLGALDIATAGATPWDPACYGFTDAIAVNGSTVFVGGMFSMCGGEVRHRLAAIDLATHHVTAWNPTADNSVSTLIADGPTIYAGGSFDSIGTARRRFLAAIDAATGLPTAWDPAPDGSVRALAKRGSALIAGGTFKHIGGQPRERMGAVDSNSGLATAWVADADSTVRTLTVQGSVVYAGGSFRHIDGLGRSLLAALDATTGSPTAWNPGADGLNPDVYAIAPDGDIIYVGGDFLTIGGASRAHVAAIDATTGLATSWTPGFSQTAYTLALGGPSPGASVVYVGGEILGAFDTADGNVTGWNPGVGGVAQALAATTRTVYIGGDLTGPDQFRHSGYSVVPADQLTPTLVSLFDSESLEDGILLRWEFAIPERVTDTWFERSTSPAGPWRRLALVARAAGRAESAIDRDVEHGVTYWYRLAATIAGNTVRVGPIAASTTEALREFGLTRVTPSPASGPVTIEFTMARGAWARLQIVDVNGRRVANMVDANRHEGRYQAVWNGADRAVRPGVYFVVFEAAGRRTTRRIVVRR